MTRISLIHAVPRDEYAHRGKNVASPVSIPYLSMTAGEMRLDLLKQRLTLLSQFYPEEKTLRQGAQLVDAALKAGLHRGVNFVGSIADQVQPVARIIAQSVRLTQPAAGRFYGRASMVQGIGEIIPVADRLKACLEATKKIPIDKVWERMDAISKCKQAFEIETIFNERIEDVSHHVVYKGINESYPVIPSRVFTKLVLHNAGIGGMANTAELQNVLMSEWVENGIMFKNAAAGIGPVGSVTTSYYLSPDPDADLEKYTAWQKQRGISGIGAIGFDPATLITVIALIGAALGAAVEFLTKLQKAKFMAMASAQGFGTDAYKASTGDWTGGSNNPIQEGTDKTLMYAALAAGAYFLLQD